jgi:hypothetical protein
MLSPPLVQQSVLMQEDFFPHGRMVYEGPLSLACCAAKGAKQLCLQCAAVSGAQWSRMHR